ncbi:MAG: NUDIX hydrolase [Alphaproteobacteria bacterium]|nr:NUDIX hydrolase [Alphaproteobacteria bacterium]
MSTDTPAPTNPWTVLSSRDIYRNPWIAVEEHQMRTPAGTPGIYGIVRFVHTAVGCIPIHEDGTTVLIGQWRVPLGCYSWEIPEGGGKPGENPRLTAARELAEEAGLVASSWVDLVEMDLSNSVTDERAHVYLCWDLSPVATAPEETEQLAIRRLPFAEAYRLAVTGGIRDSLSVAGLMRARLLALEGGLPEALARHLRP